MESRTWITNPEAYRARLETLVGGRDPLAVMAETAGTLEDIVAQHPATRLRARPFPGKWTANEVLGHLVDTEWVYGYRIRRVVSEDAPHLTGTDQDRWVARQGHNDRDPREWSESFRTMRELNLAFYRRLQPEDLARVGLHNERGPESVTVILRITAGHDLSHIDQIHRCLLAANGGPK